MAAAPVAAAASAALPYVMDTGKFLWKNREGIYRGGKTAIKLAQKYGTAVKPLANMMLHVRGRRKAASYLMNKIKNPVKTAGEISDYIKSGKAKTLAKNVIRDVNKGITAAEQISGRDLGKHRSIVNEGAQKFDRYHDVLSSYNDQARGALLS